MMSHKIEHINGTPLSWRVCSAIARLLFSNLPGGSAYDFPNRASRHSLDCLKAFPAIVSTVRRPVILSNVRAPRSPEVCPRPYAAPGDLGALTLLRITGRRTVETIA